MFKRKLNLKSQQHHYKNLFPKNKCTHCGSISSPKDNFHFSFLPFFTINTVLCDFLFVITEYYKSMYLLLPAATVNFDMQYCKNLYLQSTNGFFLFYPRYLLPSTFPQSVGHVQYSHYPLACSLFNARLLLWMEHYSIQVPTAGQCSSFQTRRMYI